MAPLGHHAFDSTHVSFGVVTAAVERGRFTFEASVFNGREPDDERWDFDFGALDSFAGRIWFRPSEAWEVQVSSGKLHEPEELVEGDLVRTTTSVSFFRTDARGFKAFTGGYGVNAAHGELRHGVFGEFTVERGANRCSGGPSGNRRRRACSSRARRHGITLRITCARVHHQRPKHCLWRGFDGASPQVVFYRVPDAHRDARRASVRSGLL